MFVYQLVNHPQSFAIDTSRIDRIFALVADATDIPQSGTINIAWLTDDEIQVLNREYRGIDATTDVLSFHYFDDFSALSGDDIAGEIILSESRIISQAIEHGHSSERECEILIAHSLLHILGYDHETDAEYREMWMVEEKLRKLI